MSKAWGEQRDAVLGQGQAVTKALREIRPASEPAPLSAELLDAGYQAAVTWSMSPTTLQQCHTG
ncbi:MAG: hypothetical protein ACRDUA_04200 [Micromonosporaceae bacterium]